MRRLEYGGITFPRVYLCEPAEADECRRLGVPYIVRPDGWSDEKVLAAMLYGWLREHFPMIDWRTRLFHGTVEMPEVHVPYRRIDCGDTERNHGELQDSMPDDTAWISGSEDYRASEGTGFDGGLEAMREERMLTVDDFLSADPTFHVDVEDLQALRLLPTFVSKVADAISLNLDSMAWNDGWSKKYDANMGRYFMAPEKRNLIILDVSSSIPRSVSSTMVGLIDTLRRQANADLIVTASTSVWFSREEDIDADLIANMVGGGNETGMFKRILIEHVFGREWGNVITFGDDDCPCYSWKNSWRDVIDERDMAGTTVDHLMCFHTGGRWGGKVTGYGLWAERLVDVAQIEIDTSWVKEA